MLRLVASGCLLSLLLLGCDRAKTETKTPPLKRYIQAEAEALKSDDADSDEDEESDIANNYDDHLKVLDWLKGTWVDKNDEKVDVTLNFDWDINQNFLIQHFQMKSPEEDELQGIQIIGWEPVKKEIHSWIFDSDGTIGEASWTIEDQKVIADTAYILPDGQKGSAVYTYAKGKEGTFTFSSQNRDMGGQMLPNLGPYTFEKKGDTK